MIRSLVTLVLLAGLGACGLTGGEEQVDGDAAVRALEQQRPEVREAARTLLLAAERELTGTTRNANGSYRGCQSAFPEGFRNYRYLVQARIDAGPRAGGSYLEMLRPVLEDAGFTVEDLRGEANGFTSLVAVRGELSASFVHTGGRFVGLDVSGPCVEVPEDQRERWLREEPDPEIR